MDAWVLSVLRVGFGKEKIGMELRLGVCVWCLISRAFWDLERKGKIWDGV